MPIPKRHHYVPEMILNGFTDRDGWLHWCRHSEDSATIRRARPSELFHQNHLYSTLSESGIKDPAMEFLLSAIETDAASVVTEILCEAREGRFPALSPAQKGIWYLFFLLQWRRTPEGQRSATSEAEALRMVDEILEELRTIAPNRLQEIETLSTAEAKARTVRNVRVRTLLAFSNEVMGVLERRGIAVLKVRDRRKSFIVGSRPVVKLSQSGRTHLDDPSVEMWLPIASDVAVGVGKGDGQVSLHYTLDEKPVRQLNLAIAKQSGTIAACSPALVRSIANPR